MKPVQTRVSVVLLGRFRPSEFELARLSSTKVLSKGDLDEARYEALLRDQIVAFTLPWGKLTVLTDKLDMDVSQVPYVRGVDLVLKLLHEVAPTSVVMKLGINAVSHFQFGNAAERDKFATRLVPPRAWGMFGSHVEGTLGNEGLAHGGVMSVQMRWACPEGRSAGWLDANVQASPILQGAGVQIAMNDHFELSEDELTAYRRQERAVSEHLLSELERRFDDSLERSFGLAQAIVEEK